MIARFFIGRPVLSTAIGLLLVLAGLIGLRTLPQALYPNIYPPIVSVSASFPGASADTVRASVATPIEQELNGTPNMVYMESNCSSTGGLNLTVTFDVDADFDDQDHEWYEVAEDPHEVNNLANDRGRRNELRGLFDRLKAMEAAELRPT